MKLVSGIDSQTARHCARSRWTLLKWSAIGGASVYLNWWICSRMKEKLVYVDPRTVCEVLPKHYICFWYLTRSIECVYSYWKVGNHMLQLDFQEREKNTSRLQSRCLLVPSKTACLSSKRLIEYRRFQDWAWGKLHLSSLTVVIARN